MRFTPARSPRVGFSVSSKSKISPLDGGTKVVIDPSQERLEREFDGVRRTHVPLHAIVRIDEVKKEGVGRISTPKGGDSGNVRPFPTILPSGGDNPRE